MNISRYRTYNPEIKRQIMESGNPNLFPGLNIPRSTARYWIEKARPIKSEGMIDKSLKDRIKKLEKELIRERQKVMFLEKHIQVIAGINEYKVKKKDRSLVVNNIESYRYKIGIGKCLQMTNLSRNKFERWRLKHCCKITGRYFCGKSRGNQLTPSEQKKLIKMANSKRYAHMSVKSLQMYCIRKNILCCSLDSWYKYINLYQIDRSKFCSKKRKKYGLGIRADSPNQLWHVDVTQIKLLGGQKAYLQVIIDNYSRYVVSWKISESINATNTVETIRDALKIKKSDSLMMDAGTENTNNEVAQVLLHENIKRIISKRDVKWSNSIVEALFRSLKNNYLYLKVCKTIEELKRRVNFYLNQHNSVIPHSSFDGATPFELYSKKWTLSMAINLTANISKAVGQRISQNQRSLCCFQR